MKTNAIELPPIKIGDKTDLVSCPTAVAVQWNDGKDKFSRDIKKPRLKPPSVLQRRYIPRSRPCFPGALSQKKGKEKQDFKKEFICLGVHLTCWKDKANANTPGKEIEPFNDEKSKPDVNYNQYQTKPTKNTAIPVTICSGTNTNAMIGPTFRPWAITVRK